MISQVGSSMMITAFQMPSLASWLKFLSISSQLKLPGRELLTLQLNIVSGLGNDVGQAWKQAEPALPLEIWHRRHGTVRTVGRIRQYG